MTNSDLRIRMIFAGLLWVGVFITQSAQADDLSGFDDPALLAAIEVWLQDNDTKSLPVFASLAGEGNKAARMLVARIEATEQAASNYVSGLSRKERMDLFRSNSGKGLFRPTWLKSEMLDGNKLAAVLLESSLTTVNIPAIRTLYEIGEEEAAYNPIRMVATSGSQDDKKELEDLRVFSRVPNMTQARPRTSLNSAIKTVSRPPSSIRPTVITTTWRAGLKPSRRLHQFQPCVAGSAMMRASNPAPSLYLALPAVITRSSNLTAHYRH